MAIPPTAIPWPAAHDPRSKLDYIATFAGVALEEGETIVDWTITLSPEAVALGLEIMTGDGRDPDLVLDDTAIRLWLTVDPAFQANAAYSGGGVTFGIEFWIKTSSTPFREQEATKTLTVAQR